MTRSIRKRTPVVWDLIDAADYIGQRNLRAADRFLDAAEATFNLLRDSPDLGIRCEYANSKLHELRAWPIRGFRKFVVYYFPQPDGIEILRVLHGSRDTESHLNAT